MYYRWGVGESGSGNVIGLRAPVSVRTLVPEFSEVQATRPCGAGCSFVVTALKVNNAFRAEGKNQFL